MQGLPELRHALAGYLASSRSVQCTADSIIITSGAQQALSLAIMTTVKGQDSLLVENPGYLRVNNIVSTLGLKSSLLPVNPKIGMCLEDVTSSNAKTLYITPSNQYPMGTTIDLDQRLALLQWAQENNRWVIEDDYDSEFQFAHQPYTSLQGLSSQITNKQQVIYIGSMSKVMFNGLRLGYMVVPSALLKPCLALKDALTGFTPSHPQAALTDFICEGHLVRHIRKMRRLYEKKYQLMENGIQRYFGNSVEIISQKAGLHLTLEWKDGISENEFTVRAKYNQIIIRPLSYYEDKRTLKRTWQSVVLGFGNVALEQIEPKLKQLADLFFR